MVGRKSGKDENIMPNYAFFYYGEPKFDSPEEGAKEQERFMAWVTSLGDALVNPGTPLGMARTVNASGVSDGASSNRLTGFSLVRADSMDAALEMAKGCPFLRVGTVDVAEVMEMGI